MGIPTENGWNIFLSASKFIEPVKKKVRCILETKNLGQCIFQTSVYPKFQWSWPIMGKNMCPNKFFISQYILTGQNITSAIAILEKIHSIFGPWIKCPKSSGSNVGFKCFVYHPPLGRAIYREKPRVGIILSCVCT